MLTYESISSMDCVIKDRTMSEHLQKQLCDIFANYMAAQQAYNKTPDEIASDVLKTANETWSEHIFTIVQAGIQSIEGLYNFLQQKQLESFRSKFKDLLIKQNELAKGFKAITGNRKTEENFNKPYNELAQRCNELLKNAANSGFSEKDIKCLTSENSTKLQDPIFNYQINNDFEFWSEIFPFILEQKKFDELTLQDFIKEKCRNNLNKHCNDKTVCYHFLDVLFTEASFSQQEFETLIENILIHSDPKDLEDITLENFFISVSPSPGKARLFFQSITPLLVYYGIKWRELNSRDISRIHDKYFVTPEKDITTLQQEMFTNMKLIDYNNFSSNWKSFFNI